MFDHVGLQVTDLARSAEFYTAALAPLGLVLGHRDEACAGFGPSGSPSLWLHACTAPVEGTVHVALQADDAAAVRAFHDAALRAGGRDHGAPGLRVEYAAGYFAAFVRDPDGNNIEAVAFIDASTATRCD
ncbi:MAG: VOC family protein [Chromatocurvus sp.]